jgi:hypothetical protein
VASSDSRCSRRPYAEASYDAATQLSDDGLTARGEATVAAIRASDAMKPLTELLHEACGQLKGAKHVAYEATGSLFSLIRQIFDAKHVC